MVLQRRLDYGFNGYQVPVVPRASRSVRVINATIPWLHIVYNCVISQCPGLTGLYYWF